MVIERTTDLEAVRTGSPYTWGHVIAIHQIGQYTVIEHHPWKSKGPTVLTGCPDEAVRQFDPYIDGKKTGRGYSSMDEALVGAIAYKLDGSNTRADVLIMRMLGAYDRT